MTTEIKFPFVPANEQDVVVLKMCYSNLLNVKYGVWNKSTLCARIHYLASIDKISQDYSMELRIKVCKSLGSLAYMDRWMRHNNDPVVFQEIRTKGDPHDKDLRDKWIDDIIKQYNDMLSYFRGDYETKV